MVSILMAVYNGEKYLAQQIESILAQNFTDWKLVICDDRSSDSSFEIIEKFSDMYPDKIVAYRNEVPTGSAQANFMNMLKYSDTEYTMFSDQDDVWLPEKIALTLTEMKRMEKAHGDVPLLVHTDMAVVDSDLSEIEHSFMKYCGLNARKKTLNYLVVQNNISGCTMMINRALLELVKDAPSTDMIMHDWWFGLAASAFGAVGFVNSSTSLYRQHDSNELGAKHYEGLRTFCKLVWGFIKRRFMRKTRVKHVHIAVTQAQKFIAYYGSELPERSGSILSAYTETVGANFFERWYRLFKFRLWRQNFVARLAQVLMMSY